MIFHRFEVPGLAQYSYAIACESSKEVLIVDPKRDCDLYIDYATQEGYRITHVFETHIHADYASGAKGLAELTGADIYLSKYDAGEEYEASFPHNELADGDSVTMGTIRMEALHTPGHTPEHLSYLFYDETDSKTLPQGILSGDFLFVGSLGRPDLLGEEQKHALAEQLYKSVRERIKDLPDDLRVFPGHGAGSMCGAGLGGYPDTTIGEQRQENPYFDESLDKEQFIDRILNNVPPFPGYFRRMKELNSRGAPTLNTLPGNKALSLEDFKRELDSGAVVIDLRDQVSFGAGHIPNSFGIAAGRGLSTWASWVVPYDTPILLVASELEDVEEAIRSLVRVGFDNVRGFLEHGFLTWSGASLPVGTIQQLVVSEVRQRQLEGGPFSLLDVRSDVEWNRGHIEGAIHIMGGELPQRLDELPRDGRPIAVICQGGFRSTVAASVLKRSGFNNVFNATLGMQAWHNAGYSTTRAIQV